MKTVAVKPERLFRALAERTRLRILCLLLRGELCVCDIVAVLDVPQPTASRHLAYLRRAGLVRVRKEGVWCYYRLAATGSDLETALLKCLESCTELPQMARDRERYSRGCRGCCD